MKIEIFGTPETAEKVLRLRLVSTSSGGVMLVAVDDNGVRVTAGNLLEITARGTLWTASSISGELGLALDGSGHLEIER